MQDISDLLEMSEEIYNPNIMAIPITTLEATMMVFEHKKPLPNVQNPMLRPLLRRIAHAIRQIVKGSAADTAVFVKMSTCSPKDRWPDPARAPRLSSASDALKLILSSGRVMEDILEDLDDSIAAGRDVIGNRVLLKPHIFHDITKEVRTFWKDGRFLGAMQYGYAFDDWNFDLCTADDLLRLCRGLRPIFPTCSMDVVLLPPTQSGQTVGWRLVEYNPLHLSDKFLFACTDDNQSELGGSEARFFADETNRNVPEFRWREKRLNRDSAEIFLVGRYDDSGYSRFREVAM